MTVGEVFPGARTVMKLPPSEPVFTTSAEIARSVGRSQRVSRQILSCSACRLRASCRCPVPPTLPAAPEIDAEPPVSRAPLCLVLGEAPGPDEDREGKPFVGKSGKLMRELLDEAGIDSERVAYANVVQCFPNEDWKIRAPKKDEVEACSSNLESILSTVSSNNVLLVGALASSRWRPDYTVTELHGKLGIWNAEKWVMPIFHPAYLLRNRQPAYRKMVRAALGKWAALVRSEVDGFGLLAMDCVVCGSMCDGWDRDGIAYCDTHMERGVKRWETQRKLIQQSSVTQSSLT